jgi:hypothetical protein
LSDFSDLIRLNKKSKSEILRNKNSKKKLIKKGYSGEINSDGNFKKHSNKKSNYIFERIIINDDLDNLKRFKCKS